MLTSDELNYLTHFVGHGGCHPADRESTMPEKWPVHGALSLCFATGRHRRRLGEDPHWVLTSMSTVLRGPCISDAASHGRRRQDAHASNRAGHAEAFAAVVLHAQDMVPCQGFS